MSIFPFWSQLEPGRRFLYLLFAFLTLFALGFGIYGYFWGTETVFPTVKIADLYPAEAALFTSEPLLTPLHVKVNAYLVSEQYGVGNMQLPLWGSGVYFGVLALAMAFFWALISTFKRIPYFIGVTLGMLWLATLNLDLLGIFAETGRTLLFIGLAVLGITSYLFQAFWPRFSLFKRFGVFALLILALGSALLYFSPLPAPLTMYHVVQYGTLGSFIASFLFIILVAYENLHGLLWFNTQAQQPQRRFGLLQFVVISFLYLGNLLLLFLNQTGTISLDFAGIDALLVFLVSVVTGFWGLKQRQPQYGRFFRFDTEMLPLYLVLALLTFLNLGYAFLMANDPMVQAYRGAIVITHLAYGASFFIYLLVNFGPLIKQKLRVYKVVYDPRRLPYFMVYVGGTIILMLLLSVSNFSVYVLSQAGRYNYLGDLYLQTEDKPLLAEQYYLEGQAAAFSNQRSSLSLTDMYHRANLRTQEMFHLRELLARKSSPDVYLRLANLFTPGSDLFEHLNVLQEGIKKYPDDAPLLNNLGLLYSTTTFKDSAAYYLDAALLHSNEPEVIQANQLAFLARHSFTQQAQEFAVKYQGEYGPLQTNRWAIALMNGAADSAAHSLIAPLPDSVLTTQTFAHFNNVHLQRSSRPDSAALLQVEKLLRQEQNEVFAQDLTLVKAFELKRLGQPTFAKEALEHLAVNNPKTAGYYYDILGQWMLQNKLHSAAANYFARAADLGYQDAKLHSAVALALTGKPSEAAQIALEAANATAKPSVRKAATRLAMVTQMSTSQAAEAPDSLKVPFIQLRSASLPLEELEQIASQITTPHLAPAAALPLVKRYLAENDFAKAGQLLQNHFPASFPKNSLKSEANALVAELWWKSQQFQRLEKELPTLYFGPQEAATQPYYLALLAQRNKKPQAATHHFNQLTKVAPWSEIGQLAAATFFINQGKDLRAYDLLLEAMEYNPASVALRKAYIRMAIRQGFEKYARQAMEPLAPLVSPAEYLSFKNEIDTLQQQAASQAW